MAGWFDRAAAMYAADIPVAAVDAWQLPEPAPEAPSDSFPAITATASPSRTATPDWGGRAGQTPEAADHLAARAQVQARQPQVIGPTREKKPRGRWFRGK
ncbi:hypothetical protein C1Y63_10675 [Corynebacterium sp. 13CS0277]|uniref:hypothetical protein n=1 Tax=Corynebacterium sp. 13CS0277 TaxID=2071994 RepID=UPI000D02F41A|nr:hypothetical protein [Corynebacterium sp. 13CS0277]PRQ10569.1 hypothetical protein C1Y63_10675 [Corynebacterium sp. 13CS0277]